MTNFEAIKQMSPKNFASMIFDIVKLDCKTEADFVAILEKEISTELERVVKRALQEMQYSSSN